MNAVDSHIWLRGNRRLLWAGLTAPVLVMLACGGVLVFGGLFGNLSAAWLILTSVVLAAAVIVALMIAWVGRLPRLTYNARDRSITMYLPGPKPYHVPLDIVECFFLGSGITQIPGQPSRDVQTKNIVVRLAERATDWHRRDLTLSIGKWCEGYITIRGLYCEPIDIELVKRMNALLHQAQQAAKVPLPSEPTLVQGQLLTTGAESLQDAP